jgi:hypothetical protein
LNPNIFEYDYKEIKNRFHPSNMDKWYDWGFDDIAGIAGIEQ